MFKAVFSLLMYVSLCHLALSDCGMNNDWVCYSGPGKSSGCSPCCNWRGLLVDGKMHRIPDNQIKGSSFWTTGHEPTSVRLFKTTDVGAWVPGETDPNPWIEFDLGKTWVILAIVTRGRHEHSQWVTSYKVKHAATVWDYNAGNWRYVMNRPAPEITADDPMIFLGNHDMRTIHVNWLAEPIKAQYIRIYPMVANGVPKSMRADLIGCFDNV